MIKKITHLIPLILLMCACNLPQNQDVPTPVDTNEYQDVATQVSELLTVIPTSTELIIPSPTNTPEIIEETSVPEEEIPTDNQTNSGEGPVITISETPADNIEEGETIEDATETPTLSPTPLISYTPTPTRGNATSSTEVPVSTSSSSVQGDPKDSLGDPTFEDSFDTIRGWSTGSDDYSDVSIKDGTMTITANTDIDSWRMSWASAQNFYLEVKFTTKTCSGSGHYGVIFRVPDISTADRGYLYGFTCDGQYSLRTWDSENMSKIINWTANDAIKTGENVTNRLGVLVQGNKIVMYANGIKLGEAEDSTFTDGNNIGIMVGKGTTEGLTVEVDDFMYWVNPNL